MLAVVDWNPIMEALLFAVGDEGLSIDQISIALEVDHNLAGIIISQLKESFERSDRGIEIVELAGKYQFVTKREHAVYLRRLVEVPSVNTLSQAALETLAIIAYKQPITRMEIETIRGVKIDGPIQKLISRALIKEVGRTDSVGRAILFGTTREFLDYFGLKSLEELPALPEENENEDQETELFSLKFQESGDSDGSIKF